MVVAVALLACSHLAVPAEVMHHVAMVESSGKPYAIGVVGGRLLRQPETLAEAVATAQALESRGYDFSVGVAQVNRRNFTTYGLDDYVKAFSVCDNLQAGSRILADCYARHHGAWGKALSCYYSGDAVTGFRDGYVQKVFASMGGHRSTDAAWNVTEVVAPMPRSGLPPTPRAERRLRDARPAAYRVVQRSLPLVGEPDGAAAAPPGRVRDASAGGSRGDGGPGVATGVAFDDVVQEAVEPASQRPRDSAAHHPGGLHATDGAVPAAAGPDVSRASSAPGGGQPASAAMPAPRRITPGAIEGRRAFEPRVSTVRAAADIERQVGDVGSRAAAAAQPRMEADDAFVF